VGGYRPLPAMEDLDIVRRIGRRRIVLLRSRAMTGAERFRGRRHLRPSFRNLSLLALYTLRVPVRVLARLYG
jgi:hypothetical protein